MKYLSRTTESRRGWAQHPPTGPWRAKLSRLCVASLTVALSSAVVTKPAPAQAQESDASLSLVDLLEMRLVESSTLKAQAAEDAPSSVAVITHREIMERGYRTIKDVLVDVAGVIDVSDVNEEVVSIRGTFATTSNKTLTLVNGHRMNDMELARYNMDQFIGLDVVERIEVIRGPGSAIHGTGAMNGVINIVTRKGADIGGRTAKLRLGPNSREYVFTIGEKLGNADMLFNFTMYDASGQSIDFPANYDRAPNPMEFPRANPAAVPTPGSVFLRRHPHNWAGLFVLRTDNEVLTMRGSHFVRATPRGRDGFYNPETEPFPPRYTMDDFFVDYARTFNISPAQRLVVQPMVHYYRYQEMSFLRFGAEDIPPLGDRSGVLDEHTVGGIRAYHTWDILPNLNLTSGMDGRVARWLRQDGIAIDQASQTYTLRRFGAHARDLTYTYGFFTQGIYSLLGDKLVFTGGLRFDLFEQGLWAIDGEPPAPKLTPRLGVVYKPIEGLSFKALYAQSYLAPNVFHLSSADPNFVGNPDLHSEKMDAFELIGAYRRGKYTVSADLYYNKASDFINQVNGVYQNTGQADYYGGDLATEARINRFATLRASYSQIRSTDSTSEGNLIMGNNGRIRSIPRHNFRFGASSSPIEGLTLTLFGRGAGTTYINQSIDGATELDPYVTFDATIRYLWRSFTFQLYGTNIFGSKYRVADAGPGQPLPRLQQYFEASVAYNF
ncbi:MAG: TonB-dependent receptor [Myxococcales bacterium]|nr:TonB-dependent receptor [Myxococcales bacterium]